MTRIATWSGPRNLSTAMMYAFGAREDCDVVDEPFYAAYLAETGLDHPMRDAVLASQPHDPAQVVANLSVPRENHLYIKLMTQHMTGFVPLGWLADVAHVFLIRHPARVVASYGAKRDGVTAADLGFHRQRELLDHVRAAGLRVTITDSADIRRDPETELRRICAEIDVPWRPEMLCWPTGGHRSDGVWAPHWYGAVHRSTGFAGAEGPLPSLDEGGRTLVDEIMPDYEAMVAAREA